MGGKKSSRKPVVRVKPKLVGVQLDQHMMMVMKHMMMTMKSHSTFINVIHHITATTPNSTTF
jgi:hypothetical protein